MDLLFALPMLTLVTVAYLTRQRLGARLGPVVDALREFNTTQVELWDRYLRDLRPWEGLSLHWVHTSQGPRLEGRILPPCGDKPQCRVPPAPWRSP